MRSFVRRITASAGILLALTGALSALAPPAGGTSPAATKAPNTNGVVALGVGFATIDHAPYGTPSLIAGQLRVAGGATRLRATLLLDLGLVTDPVAMPIEGGGTVECNDDPGGAACVHLMGSIFLGAELHAARRGPYAVAGLGFTYETVIVGNEDITLDIPGAGGLSYVVGGGFDLEVGRWLLTPYVHYLLTPKFDTKEEAHGGAEMRRLMIGLTVGGGGSGSKH